MKLFPPPKQDGSSSVSNGTTRQNMAVGSPHPEPVEGWRSPSSAFSTSQCLDREIDAWEEDRNANHAKADWRFTTAKAHIKLKHPYASI
jgi:hypothetical protein